MPSDLTGLPSPRRDRVTVALLAAGGALLVGAAVLGGRGTGTSAGVILVACALVVSAGPPAMRAALSGRQAISGALLAAALLLVGLGTAAAPWWGAAAGAAPPEALPGALGATGLLCALVVPFALLRDAGPTRSGAGLDAAVGGLATATLLSVLAGSDPLDALERAPAMLLLPAALGAVLAVSTGVVAGARAWSMGVLGTAAGPGLLLLGAAPTAMIAAGPAPAPHGVALLLGGLGALLVAAGDLVDDHPLLTASPTAGSAVVAPLAAIAVATLTLAWGALDVASAATVLLAVATVAVAGVRTSVALRDVRVLAETKREARTDDLTRLGNRRAFAEHADREIDQARSQRLQIALVLLDLDRFKDVNDTLGHEAGDRLLRAAGHRLAKCQPAGRVYRLGGDEFVMLLPVGSGVADARRAADTIRVELERPVEIEGVTTAPKASVGIAVFPDHGANRNELLRAADIAMYRAKKEHAPVVLYSREKDGHSRDHLQLAGELSDSIEAGDQLAVYYQPKANLRTGRLEGVEALVRWEHPSRGILPPNLFLPLAAKHGLMRGLTLSVLDRALAQQRAWREAGLDVQMAVNLAAANVLDIHLPLAVRSIMQRHDARPDRVVLEISEDTVMLDPERTLDLLSQLVGLGVSLSLDDFGTGHSSLTYLKRLPIRELKVDGSFVMGMLDDEADATIVQSTVTLARNLGLHVVAEGVETREHWERLHRMDCDTAQGYLLARPLPAVELEAWAREHGHLVDPDHVPAGPGSAPVALRAPAG